MERRLLVLVDRVLRKLTSVRSSRVCYLSNPDFGDSAYFVFRHLVDTRRDLEHVWLLNDSASEEKIRTEFAAASGAGRGHSLRIELKRSLRGYLLQLTSRYTFYTHGLYAFIRSAPRGRVVVCLWHGMPLKAIGALDATGNRGRPFGTIHLASSHLFKYIIARAFEVEAQSVKVVGLPRCDALRGGSRDRPNAAREALQIPTDRKLVLWLPTFRERLRGVPGSARSFLDDVPEAMFNQLSRCAAEAGCTVIVKLHPQDRLNLAPARFDHSAIWLMTAAEWTRRKCQLYDLVAASDGLLSDVSSVIVDYLETGRPIGIIGYDSKTYDRNLTLPMSSLLRSDRVKQLSDGDSISRFFADVINPQLAAPHDLAILLNEVRGGSSADLVVREAGL